MSMPEVHSCVQMMVENGRLKKLVRRLKRDKDALSKELHGIREEQKIATMLKQMVTTRNMEVQTDPTRAVYKPSGWINRPQTIPTKKSEKNVDTEKLNKMMILHNNLMKRYEKELRVNMDHLETITTLNLRVNKLQQKLLGLENQTDYSRTTSRTKSKRSSKDKDDRDLQAELATVKSQRDALLKENKRLKHELKGLDPGFFEEVEDIKFALQQSAKLNKQYEKCLKKMCKQFGMPYPHPERALDCKT